MRPPLLLIRRIRVDEFGGNRAGYGDGIRRQQRQPCLWPILRLSPPPTWLAVAWALARTLYHEGGLGRTTGTNRLEDRRPIRIIIDRFFVQMLLHGESNILTQTTFPSRLEEIPSLLGKGAFGIVQNRIMLDLRMQREPCFDLISACCIQDRVISANLQTLLSTSSLLYWYNRQDDDRTTSQPVFRTMR